jgi:hypothetical protein
MQPFSSSFLNFSSYEVLLQYTFQDPLLFHSSKTIPIFPIFFPRKIAGAIPFLGVLNFSSYEVLLQYTFQDPLLFHSSKTIPIFPIFFNNG